jgi:TonB-linked SusC/RagA family outer membrane protein
MKKIHQTVNLNINSKNILPRFICFLFAGFACFSNLMAQDLNETAADQKEAYTDGGLRSEKTWRTTGASFTISGAELEKMTVANLWNTLQGRIPGLTVMSGSGEPGYDDPTLVGRGLNSWNLTGNNIPVFLDGFQVNMTGIDALSVHEIESVTYLKDAASLAIFGLKGGVGVLSIITKRGIESAKPIITVNARYGVQKIVDLPSVMNAYDYTRLYNQARENDGLTQRYANPELYLNGGDEAHPDVNWYNEMLKEYAYIQDYNISFKGGNQTARYFVLLDYANSSGFYKNADEIDKDFGANAKYNKFRVRGNVDIDVSKNFSVKAQISGIVEDRDTPSGFSASNAFSAMMNTPAAAFSIKNPDGSWGNSTVYDFNPVMRLKTGGVYNAQTRNVQANLSFNEKLDVITPGLNLTGSISFSDQFVGFTNKNFTGLSYMMRKDAQDAPILDADGNYTYTTIGTITDAITDGESSHWNRQTMQAGFTYDRSFDEHSVTGMLLARRHSYAYNTQVYEDRHQGISFSATYDYAKRYIVDLSASYMGSDEFEKGKRYGLFPALGLAWIASNENFLKDNKFVNFLKLRGSYGITGNTNSSYRFLYEQWAATNSGWNLTTDNTWYTGRREGNVPNYNFRWEEKASVNFGIETQLFKKLSVNLDVFTEKRTGILENIAPELPGYTAFRLAAQNSGEVRNSGFEAVIGYNDRVDGFEYYAKGLASFARNKILKRAETLQPHDWLYAEGYRINQQRGLIYDGFYQESDFDADGLLKEGVVRSTYGNVKPGDFKYKDQNNDLMINDYDKIPIGYSNVPELTLGFNLGFKYKGFDFDAFVEGVTNRTIGLPYNYTHPLVDNRNITVFSANAWTPETAATATSPRLTTQNNPNNTQSTDFYMRDGSFIKLRSIELGYTFTINKRDLRVFANGTNLFIWDKIDDLEAESLSMGYPLSKAVALGLKLSF